MDWGRPGPFRAFRDRYVAPFAGVSYDLAPGAVGVAPDRLQNAPELPGRIVLVSHDDLHGPLVRRPAFVVVKLTQAMRDALQRASSGGIVFSSFDLDDPVAAPVLDGLDVGASVFLNAAVSRLPDIALRRPSLT